MDRDYVRKDGPRFIPSKLGRAVTGLLVEHFPDVMDVGFTAGVEEKLDNIAEGERQWTPVIREFYEPFDKAIDRAMTEAERVPRENLNEETDEVCDDCASPMVITSGRFGPFMACARYPDCKFTRPVESEEDRALRELVSEDIDEACEKCGSAMLVKTGRSGRFIACSGYPDCKNAKPLPVGIACDNCGGAMVERKQRGRNGGVFYGCVTYPECKRTVNPLPHPCPSCGGLLTAKGRGRGRSALCYDADCGFAGPIPKQPDLMS